MTVVRCVAQRVIAARICGVDALVIPQLAYLYKADGHPVVVAAVRPIRDVVILADVERVAIVTAVVAMVAGV